VTQNSGTMRIVRPDNGSVSAPLAGVPPVKSAAAQGLHDVVLDPDFAKNRVLYFTISPRRAVNPPPPGRVTHFYEDVWTKPFAERRTMDLGTERGRAGEVERGLQHAHRRRRARRRRRANIVLAPDGTMFVLGADRFRFYDSDLDGVSHDFTDNPDIRPQLHGRADSHQPRWIDPEETILAQPGDVLRETFAHGFKDPEGAAINPLTRELWAVDHGPSRRR
jgi:glucose/arabinose dehydrogenase